MNEAVHKYRQLPSWRRGTWRPRRLPQHAVNEVDGALGNAAYKTTGYKAIQVIRPAMYNLVILSLAMPHGTFLAYREVLSFSFLSSSSHTAESPTKIRFRRMEAPKNEVQRRRRWHLDFYLST